MAELSPPAIDMAGLSCGYERRPVLENVSLTLPSGSFAGVVGPSGAGKTTLLKAILGLAERYSGELRVAGVSISPGGRPAGVGYVPQIETVDWSFPATVNDVVLMGLATKPGRLPWANRGERFAIAATLDDLGIGGIGARHIRDLSGGQQHRVFLARALVGKPEILILDEPTASVDIKTRDDILHHLAHLNQRGTTILMTTHELNSLAAHLPWVVCVNHGIVAQGSPSKVFTDAILSRTFNAEMRVVRDHVTGNLLVAEAGSHGPFADLAAS